jgi:hypothetical protein
MDNPEVNTTPSSPPSVPSGKIVPLVSQAEKQLRRDLEDHFLSCPVVEFAGVGSAEGKLVITLGGPRPRLIADLVPALFQDERLENRSYRVAIVRGQAKKRSQS